VTQSLGTYLIVGLMAAFWGFLFLAPLIGGSTQAQIRRAKADGRYIFVEISGKQYHVIRKTESIVRTHTGRGRAVLVNSSRDRDPDMVKGKVVMIPRLLKIRSFTAKGLSARERRVPSTNWVVEGQEEVEYHFPLR